MPEKPIPAGNPFLGDNQLSLIPSRESVAHFLRNPDSVLAPGAQKSPALGGCGVLGVTNLDSLLSGRDSALASDVDGAADRCKGLVGVTTKGRDGADAHHDDQGQHDSIFDRSWAIFMFQETDNRIGNRRQHGKPLQMAPY